MGSLNLKREAPSWVLIKILEIAATKGFAATGLVSALGVQARTKRRCSWSCSAPSLTIRDAALCSDATGKSVMLRINNAGASEKRRRPTRRPGHNEQLATTPERSKHGGGGGGQLRNVGQGDTR